MCTYLLLPLDFGRTRIRSWSEYTHLFSISATSVAHVEQSILVQYATQWLGDLCLLDALFHELRRPRPVVVRLEEPALQVNKLENA
jgi:hypothetical protein